MIILINLKHIYIKPIARVNISIQLPLPKNPVEPAPVSEITEKIRKHSAPEEYVTLRIIKHTIDFIRFEGEIENKSSLKMLIAKLDNATIKIPHAYMDVLKVRCAESKIIYPTRHEWESCYQVTQNVNEMKPGERPDTLFLQDVPVKWFLDKKLDAYKPNERIIKEVFGIFGDVRSIEILHMEKYGYKLTNDQSTFECYIQYGSYISFVKAMDTFRGMKFLYMENNDPKLASTANIRIDFDRTRYLSDKEIQKRRIEGLKQIEVDKIKNAQLEKQREHQLKKQEIEKYKRMLQGDESGTGESPNTSLTQATNEDVLTKEQRRREREETRRQKRLAKKQHEEEAKLVKKIALEERKILIAQRKLESMRLLEELFNRVKNLVSREEYEKREKELKESKEKKEEEEKQSEEAKRRKFEQEEKELQAKIEKNLREQLEARSNNNNNKGNEMDEIDRQMAIDAELAKSVAQHD
jgi:splicing factor, arginine/serine-rich 17